MDANDKKALKAIEIEVRDLQRCISNMAAIGINATYGSKLNQSVATRTDESLSSIQARLLSVVHELEALRS